MPIYEYSCTACEHELEALQKMSDKPLTDCPQCGQPSLVKKISAAAFRLSGSGWYETDFKSGKKKNLAGDAGKAEASNGTSNGTSSNAANSASGSKKTDSASGTKTPPSPAQAG